MISTRVLKPSEHRSVESLIGLIFPCAIVKLSENDIIIVAELGGTPVGFAHVINHGQHLLLQGIGVMDSMRNHGVGALLIERALALMKKSGKPIFLKVRTDNPAVDLYSRYGFCVKKFRTVMVLVKKVEN